MTEESESFWLRDMIALGQGSPNILRSLGKRPATCVCLWSKKTGYCRIFPVPLGYIHDWDILDVEVRQPTDDHRKNSFVISNYKKIWPNVPIKVHSEKTARGEIIRKKLVKEQRITLIRELANQSFSNIRDAGESFGIIKPNKLKFILRKNCDKSVAQLTLSDLDYAIMNQNDFAWAPALEYSCEKGCKSKHPHQQKIVEWGAYQYMRKDPNNKDHCQKLNDNFHLEDASYEHYVLIGNLKYKIKTYVVIKIMRFKVS